MEPPAMKREEIVLEILTERNRQAFSEGERE